MDEAIGPDKGMDQAMKWITKPGRAVRARAFAAGFLAGAAVLVSASCAPVPGTAAASTGASTAALPIGVPPVKASSAGAMLPRVDAVLPSGRNLFVFDFSQSRYQKWSLSQGPADSLGVCRVLDTLAGSWADASDWLALTSPSQPFAPMRAVWGPNGNFFLLDRVGKRLGLYDTSAQFLSGFPLPPEIRNRNLERFEVFWTRDGQFSFLDLGEGKLWQYAEIRASGGQGDWRLRNTVQLPMGLETCLWEPFFRDPCCVQGGKGVCFDKYFNPVGPWRSASGDPGLHARVAAAGTDWNLILDGGPACGKRAPACFLPGKAAFFPCPSETDAAPPR
jgi:hypothetical protein